MKKLLGFSFAFVVSLSVNAMSVNWQTAGGSVDQNNFLIYTVLASDWSNWGGLDRSAQTYNNFINNFAIGNESIGTVTADGRTYWASGTATYPALTKDSDFMFVIVTDDMRWYNWSEDSYAAKSYVYDESANPPEPSPGKATFNIKDLPMHGDGPMGYAEFAPEPTSGLLVLVGIAGLMLRRKRT